MESPLKPHQPFQPPQSLRGVFCGSGSDALRADATFAQEIISLTSKPARDAKVLYIGTPSYDNEASEERQTGRFREAGCTIRSLDLVKPYRFDGRESEAKPVTVSDEERAKQKEAARELIAWADVILVSGGNTLFAFDTWLARDIPAMLRQASARGAVMCGGSAGAICWFDGGHSDSADPETYFIPREPIPSSEAGNATGGEEVNYAKARAAWQYIRVPGIGLLPGLCCPHHDRTQSNGVLRATDFDGMLQRHCGERGVTIDHWAALVVDGEEFRVLGASGKRGSVTWRGEVGEFDLQAGVPGVWIKQADENGAIHALPLPTRGRLSDYFGYASAIVEDSNAQTIREENPHF